MISRACLPVLLLLAAVATGCAATGTLPPPPSPAPGGCWRGEPTTIDRQLTFFLLCLQTP